MNEPILDRVLSWEKRLCSRVKKVIQQKAKNWNKLEGQIKQSLSLQLLRKLEQRDQYVNVESRGIDVEMVKAHTVVSYRNESFSSK